MCKINVKPIGKFEIFVIRNNCIRYPMIFKPYQMLYNVKI